MADGAYFPERYGDFRAMRAAPPCLGFLLFHADSSRAVITLHADDGRRSAVHFTYARRCFLR